MNKSDNLPNLHSTINLVSASITSEHETSVQIIIIQLIAASNQIAS
jgi:hypothetical protein